MTTYTVSESIERLITSLMNKVSIIIPIKEDTYGINMSYNFISKTIGFDAQRLRSAHMEMAPKAPFETYIQTITLHELGHAMDQLALDASFTKTMEIFTMKKQNSMHRIHHTPCLFKMLIEEHQMNICFEETAWDNATLLNETYHLVNPCQFDIIRKASLATYHQIFNKDLALYKKLIHVPKVEPVA